MNEHHHSSRERVPVVPLLTARRIERRRRRESVAAAKGHVRAFIKILSQLQRQEKTYVLSMDLYAVFERFCGMDLPDRFQIEFGRQINKACLSGQLPFERRTHTRASLAAFDGINIQQLEAAVTEAGVSAA